MKLNDLKDKKVGILGYGVNHASLILFLLTNEVNNLTILDQNESKKEQIDKELKKFNGKYQTILGDNYLKNLSDYDVVFRTPGIPYLNPEIQKARQSGVIIYSQTKLFFDLCQGQIIGVTGTKGKGTTSNLIFHILKDNLSVNVFLGGNFGRDPFDFIDQVNKDDIVILELSSFQLQDLNKSPHIAVITPISLDHQDHHKSLKEYWFAKTNILKHQSRSDFAIICKDSKNAKKTRWFTKGKKIYYSFSENLITEYPKQFIGNHNKQNINCAIKVARILHIADANITISLSRIIPLEHRLEFITEINGYKYYNDSYSTGPESTIAAISSFQNENIVLICGGVDKGFDYKKMAIYIGKYVAIVVIFGQNTHIISELVKRYARNTTLKIVDNLDESMKYINSIEMNRGIVLFSPASASFDQFKNASERGNKFKELVNHVKAK